VPNSWSADTVIETVAVVSHCCYATVTSLL